VDFEKNADEFSKGDLLCVIPHLDGFGVSCHPGADMLIRWFIYVSCDVANSRRLHSCGTARAVSIRAAKVTGKNK
jgi:hypothetical protein